jgi:hypothetical protein
MYIHVYLKSVSFSKIEDGDSDDNENCDDHSDDDHSDNNQSDNHTATNPAIDATETVRVREWDGGKGLFLNENEISFR